MRPPDLPPADAYAHGTRARYVAAKCRCESCRAANTQYQRGRAARAKELALELAAAASAQAGRGRPRKTTVTQRWTPRGGTRRDRTYARKCEGVFGQECPTRSHLRKDSTGKICSGCRARFASNLLVPADRARAHLVALSAAGIGRRAVSAAADIADSVVHQIAKGKQLQLRRETERKILAVDAGAIADHSFVDAGETWRRVRELLAIGFTKGAIARALGRKMAALQIKRDRVLARTALEVERLHRQNAAAISSRFQMPAAAAMAGTDTGGAMFFDEDVARLMRRHGAAYRGSWRVECVIRGAGELAAISANLTA